MQDVSHCPQCRRRVLMPVELAGQLVQCPGCGATFTAGREDRPASAQASELPIAPRPDYERWEEPLRMEPKAARRRYDQDYDEDPEEARYRRRQRHLRDTAMHSVSGPATALQVTGGIAAALSGIMLFVHCMGGVDRGGPRDEFLMMGEGLGGVVIALVGLCWGLVILLGASKMRALDNHGSAMTAAIIAVLPCSPCWILGLPFGIWALTVLGKEEIREAFR